MFEPNTLPVLFFLLPPRTDSRSSVVFLESWGSDATKRVTPCCMCLQIRHGKLGFSNPQYVCGGGADGMQSKSGYYTGKMSAWAVSNCNRVKTHMVCLLHRRTQTKLLVLLRSKPERNVGSGDTGGPWKPRKLQSPQGPFNFFFFFLAMGLKAFKLKEILSNNLLNAIHYEKKNIFFRGKQTFCSAKSSNNYLSSRLVIFASVKGTKEEIVNTISSMTARRDLEFCGPISRLSMKMFKKHKSCFYPLFKRRWSLIEMPSLQRQLPK